MQSLSLINLYPWEALKEKSILNFSEFFSSLNSTDRYGWGAGQALKNTRIRLCKTSDELNDLFSFYGKK